MADFGANVLASSVALIILLAVMGLVYYFWSKANIKKKSKYFEKIHTELAPGQEVMFAGGIFGTVKSVNGDKVEIKVRSGATLDDSRYALQEISKKDTSRDKHPPFGCNKPARVHERNGSSWQSPTFFSPVSITA